ncbi:4-hydroxythreonine-4-phosphate dehydrogenase PdxA [Hydrogenophaga sp. RWCD_12]|uniref:4-hydroxythreonine-4-phosphate dehydrogenase PdxA n=1 Tax=Hydrogenophaga sp. RWCD_12 TaxID=3391190 RepID=UPI0039851E65
MNAMSLQKVRQLPLVITMGDPAGIGPEIIVQALARRPDLLGQVVVAGDVPTMERARELLSMDPARVLPQVREVGAVDAPQEEVPAIRVVQACGRHRLVPFGQLSGVAGQAAAECIAAAARWTLAGKASAMVTAPVHKEALAAAGLPHPGHTEYLQALAAEHQNLPVDRVPVRMMLSAPGLATVLVSIHVSLRAALGSLSTEGILETVRITAAHFSRCGVPTARIAVAGLNPHAGEGGLFGREDIDVIGPAVASARALGIDASGPHAPDTVFMRARQGAFDVVVAMYHDQGLIPIKLLGLEHGVNTTLGLPLIRTSPDHGTAFDLAGSGRADPSSLLAAIDAAFAMSAGAQ